MGTLGVQMQPFFEWLVQSTIQAGVIVCLILVIQAVLRNRLSVRWHHALWLILVIRMLLPWAPQSRLSVFNVVAWWDGPHASSPSPIEPSDQPPALGSTESSTNQSSGLGAATSPVARAQSVDRVPQGPAKPNVPAIHFAHLTRDALPLAWLLGALVLGIYIVAGNLRLWHATSVEAPSTDKDVLELLEECRVQMGLRTIVALVASEKVGTPVLLGFIRPRLLIPKDILRHLSREELRYVFLHELAHVKRHDIALAWLTALLQVVHWFNPLVWLAFHRMRADRELACDALVLTRTQGEGTKDYGRAIVSLLERFSFPPPLPGLAGILENKSQLKRRIAMITQFKNNSYRWSPLAAALIVALCCISLPNARSGKAAQPSTAKPAGPSVSADQPTTTLVGESNVFVDPKTGITFRKVKGFVGDNDIGDYHQLQLSPNGKFLLEPLGLRITPLDGGKPFDLVDLDWPREGRWSPDGKKVAFVSGNLPAFVISVVHVDPDTAKPTGSPETLMEGAGSILRWLPDSQGVMFSRREGQTLALWSVSIRDRTLTRITDFSLVGIPSPDRENIAYMEGPIGASKGLWVKSVKGGPPRKLDDDAHPDSWSADGKWVHEWGWTRFVRVADGRQVDIEVPAEVGRPVYPSSLDGKKMYFCRSSYDNTHLLKVVSVSGGTPCELGIGMKLEPTNHFWWLDSQAIITGGMRKGSDTTLWALPLSGGEPIPFKADVPVGGGDHLFSLSPDRKSLLVTTYKADDLDAGWAVHDVSVIPVSWQEMRTTGPAVLIFKEWHCRNFLDQPYGNVWSPDGKQVALADLGSIYVISATGGAPIQVVRVPEVVDWLNWSPDGKMIAFHQSNSEAIEVVSSSGSEPRVIFREPLWFDIRGDLCWSPDSRAIIIAARGKEVIRSVSVIDSSTRSLVNLKDLGTDWVVGLQFSPDGKLLAFGDPDGPLFLLHMDSGKVDKLPGKPWHLYWSPDGKWLSHVATHDVKVRAESVLWEMDIEEALTKLAK